MKKRLLFTIIAGILAAPAIADPITLIPSIKAEGSASPYKLRFPFIGNTSKENTLPETDADIEEAITWLNVYQSNGRKPSLSDESELEGIAIELGNLNLNNEALPDYAYPANIAASVDVSNNNLDSLAFLRPSLRVIGDINASNSGADDLTQIFLSTIGGNLDISNNPKVNDIALLGFTNIATGSHITADPAAQYQRLMDEQSPLCQRIISGDVSISSPNGDSGVDFCEVQNEWVVWFHSQNLHTDLTHDAELYGKPIYLNHNIDESGIPTSKYPVPFADRLLFNTNVVISDTSQFSSLNKVGTLTLSGGAVIGNTVGLRNIEEVDGLNINKGVVSNLDDLNNLRIVNSYVRIQDPSDKTLPENWKLRDMRWIENTEVLGTSINFYNIHEIDHLPSGNSTFCVKAKENSTTIYAPRGVSLSEICESGSEWQEYLEDVGSLKAINVQDGLLTVGFNMSYRNVLMPDDDNIPESKVEFDELPIIQIYNTAVSHVDYLSDVKKAGRVSFNKNQSLTNFEGLRGMTVESLTIRENGPLTNLDALEFVTVTDFIEISANDDYVRDLSFLERMPLTYNTINPPSIGPDAILPKGDGPFCKALEERSITLSNGNPQKYCDSHPFVEASYDGAISPRASAYQLTTEMFRDKDVKLTSRYINDSHLEGSTPLGVPIASFTAIDNRSITNLDFLRGLVVNQGDVLIGSNTSNLSDISGLEGVTFTEDATGAIILGGSGSRVRVSGISNLDSSVKKLAINTLYNFPDKMTAEGNTCTRIREGNLVLEDVRGDSLDPNTYCETPEI